MQSEEFTIRLQVFDSSDALPSDEKYLLSKALEARELAYAPYSKFKVGAAVLLDSGIIYTGNNQENVAYPSGLCAERVAIFAAMSENPKAIVEKIAITAISEMHELTTPVYPCGACRQVIAEYEFNAKKPIRMVLYGTSGKVHVLDGIGNLLPFAFNAENLLGKK
jgi:cytidine deaminase